MTVNEKIELQKQTVKAVECEECGHLMANIDADELQPGDLVTLKRVGVRVSNPETKKDICINCEFTPTKSFGQHLSEWFDSDNDDDSGFFSYSSDDGDDDTPTFGGGSSFGGFGGFGGGLFSGGGASRSF